MNFPRIDFVDGVIIIVRIAQIRRAILEVVERHLVSVGTPLLGSILLDRTILFRRRSIASSRESISCFV
jgi:hypothetical protein